MHMVLCSAGSFGDVFPFIRLGDELKKHGHRVTVFAHPAFRVGVESSGLEFFSHAPMPPAKFDQEFDSESTFNALLEEIVLPNIPVLYQWLEANFKPGEMLVISQRRLIGARLAQEKLGVPLLTVNLTPSEFETFLTQPPDRVQYLLGERLNAIRAKLKLPELDHIFEWLPSPDGILGAFPSWFHPVQPSWPAQTSLLEFPYADARPTGGAIDPIMGFLKEGDKPILFSFAPLLRDLDHCVEVAETVCRKLGKRAIILTRQPGAGRVVSDGVLTASLVIIDAILPYISGLVYLGGIGTFAEALRAGLPHLIIPLAENQKPQIEYVQKEKLGFVLPESQWDETHVTKALSLMLDDPEMALRRRAEAARYEGQHESLSSLAGFIESFSHVHGSQQPAENAVLS